MKKLFLLVVLFIFILGCTKNPVDIAEQSPDVKNFLERHPKASVSVADLSKDQSEMLINEIRIACGNQMQPDYYKRITYNESDSFMVVYVTDTINCIYTIGDEPEVIEGEVVSTQPVEAKIKNVKITAEKISEKTKEIKAVITDENIADSFELKFLPECQEWKIQPLEIYFNGTKVFDKKPDCGETNEVSITDVTQGTYNIKFSTSLGPYVIKNVQYPGVSESEFGLDLEPEKFVIAEFPTFPLNVVQTFNTDDVSNPVMSFTTSIEGILIVELNGKQIFNREVVSQPTIKLSGYLENNNSLIFKQGSFDPVCSQVSLALYLHNDELMLCTIPEESKIQMIFKNNGQKKIEKVDVFIKGKGTMVDTINLNLEPERIFARELVYDVGKVEQVILTPIYEGISCQSIIFDDIRECS